nr:response regulator transcription factor [uncultured Arsenicibacter sp.]
MAIRIAVIEDNPALLQTICRNLSLFDEVSVVFTAGDGREAVRLTGLHLPDVILMDIDMPIMNGIEATLHIRGQYPAVRILMLTVFDYDDKIFAAIRAGASGYLLKDERTDQIVNAIEEVISGGAPMSPLIAYKILGLLRQESASPSPRPDEPVASPALKPSLRPEAFDLTKREVELLERLTNGLTPAQISADLFISLSTVRKHIENIYEKLYVHSKLEAIRLAEKYRWFEKS